MQHKKIRYFYIVIISCLLIFPLITHAHGVETGIFAIFFVIFLVAIGLVFFTLLIGKLIGNRVQRNTVLSFSTAIYIIPFLFLFLLFIINFLFDEKKLWLKSETILLIVQFLGLCAFIFLSLLIPYCRKRIYIFIPAALGIIIMSFYEKGSIFTPVILGGFIPAIICFGIFLFSIKKTKLHEVVPFYFFIIFAIVTTVLPYFGYCLILDFFLGLFIDYGFFPYFFSYLFRFSFL